MAQQHRRVAETLRNYVEVAAIVAAGAWAFYQFVYVEKIKPAGEPAAAVERVSLARAARIRGIDVIAATISIRNVGKTEFEVLAQSFELAGYRYAAHPSTHVRESSAGNLRTDDFELQQRHVIVSYTTLYDGAKGGCGSIPRKRRCRVAMRSERDVVPTGRTRL